MSEFAGKSIVVTGGASGIGASAVRQFVELGGNVTIGDVNDALGQALADELGDSVQYVHVDVSKLDEVENLATKAVEAYGGLNVMVNNAGIGSFGNVVDLPAEEWHKIIAVDLDSVFFGCKAAIPHLRAAGGGAIVNTASISGMYGDYGFAAYNAAKAGVINLTRTVAMDHGKENIRCNGVCPGPIDTPLAAPIFSMNSAVAKYNEDIPSGRTGKPEDVANVIVFLASDKSAYVNGVSIPVDGGLTARTGQPNFTNLG